MGIEAGRIREMLMAGETAPNADAQGKALEALACYLFDEVPGCFTEANLISAFGSGQVDVAVGNERADDGVPLLPPIFLVECKDWNKPVDSATLGYFLWLLVQRQVELGIFMAMNGITGTPQQLTAAYSIAAGGASVGKKLILITKEDLLALASTEQFRVLLRKRYLRAFATGGIGCGIFEGSDLT